MPICVPIKDLKHTAEFAEKVNANDAVIVTRNGYDAFAAISMRDYNAMVAERNRQARAEAELIASIDEAEADFAAGDWTEHKTFMRELRERYGL